MPTVAIVGAGISGIAYADVLQRCGFSVVLYEKAQRLGGVWTLAYPQVSLQNSFPQYHLSRFPWPFPPDEHPSGTQILQYLEAAVEALQLKVCLQHEVVRARKSAEGGWDLQIRTSAETTSVHVDYLVISIGQYSEGKNRPPLVGEGEFRGQVITEREVKGLNMFDGQRVVVAGFGKSALDIATFSSERAACVHQVFRTPRWILPRTIFSLHFTYLLFNRLSTVMMPSWAHPTAVERGLHRMTPIIHTFWAGLQTLFGSIARREGRGQGPEGAKRLKVVLPSHALIPDLRSATPVTPPNYYSLVASGKIMPHRAEILRLSGDGVHLSDGTVLPADQLVLALGAHPPTFPFLSDEHRKLLESENDGPQLYRHLLHPQISGLAFAGYNHGFMHIPAAEVGALWLAALWRGELELPSVEEMESVIKHIQAWKRQHIHFEATRSCAVNARFQQYIDIILLDLGLSPYRKLPNPIAEVCGRYGAADYAGVVQEYLQMPKERPRRPMRLPM